MKDKVKLYSILERQVTEQLREAERHLSNSKREIDKAEQGMQQLKEYREEYVRVGYSNMKNVSPVEMENFHQFLLNVGAAEQQQGDALVVAYEKHEKIKNIWAQLKAKQKAMQSLLKKEEVKIIDKENKIEQKMLDEFSARIKNKLN